MNSVSADGKAICVEHEQSNALMRFSMRNTNPTTTVLRPIKLARCRPAFLNTLFYKRTEVFVESVAWAIFAIEAAFKIFARCSRIKSATS